MLLLLSEPNAAARSLPSSTTPVPRRDLREIRPPITAAPALPAPLKGWQLPTHRQRRGHQAFSAPPSDLAYVQPFALYPDTDLQSVQLSPSSGTVLAVQAVPNGCLLTQPFLGLHKNFQKASDIHRCWFGLLFSFRFTFLLISSAHFFYHKSSSVIGPAWLRAFHSCELKSNHLIDCSCF